jgi:hypothetical protein
MVSISGSKNLGDAGACRLAELLRGALQHVKSSDDVMVMESISGSVESGNSDRPIRDG